MGGFSDSTGGGQLRPVHDWSSRPSNMRRTALPAGRSGRADSRGRGNPRDNRGGGGYVPRSSPRGDAPRGGAAYRVGNDDRRGGGYYDRRGDDRRGSVDERQAKVNEVLNKFGMQLPSNNRVPSPPPPPPDSGSQGNGSLRSVVESLAQQNESSRNQNTNFNTNNMQTALKNGMENNMMGGMTDGIMGMNSGMMGGLNNMGMNNGMMGGLNNMGMNNGMMGGMNNMGMGNGIGMKNMRMKGGKGMSMPFQGKGPPRGGSAFDNNVSRPYTRERSPRRDEFRGGVGRGLEIAVRKRDLIKTEQSENQDSGLCPYLPASHQDIKEEEYGLREKHGKVKEGQAGTEESTTKVDSDKVDAAARLVNAELENMDVKAKFEEEQEKREMDKLAIERELKEAEDAEERERLQTVKDMQAINELNDLVGLDPQGDEEEEDLGDVIKRPDVRVDATLTETEKLHLSLLGLADLSTMTVAPSKQAIKSTSMLLSDVIDVKALKEELGEEDTNGNGDNVEEASAGLKKEKKKRRKNTNHLQNEAEQVENEADANTEKPPVIKMEVDESGGSKPSTASEKPKRKKRTEEERKLAEDMALLNGDPLPTFSEDEDEDEDVAQVVGDGPATSSKVDEPATSSKVDESATPSKVDEPATSLKESPKRESRKWPEKSVTGILNATVSGKSPEKAIVAQILANSAKKNAETAVTSGSKSVSERKQTKRELAGLEPYTGGISLPGIPTEVERKTTSMQAANKADEDTVSETETEEEEDAETKKKKEEEAKKKKKKKTDGSDLLANSQWEIFKMGEKCFYHHRGLRVTQWHRPSVEQLKQGMKKATEPLPVAKYREKILDHVKNNRITIICGETGCGKTTQVPQFLMDDHSIVPRGKYIIVTQPRKIAAVTNSERIATERGHSIVGGEIGFQIRFHNKTDEALTRLVFCTTAVVLRRLFEDPSLKRCACLIIDEVHERDVHSEFLLTTLKDKILNGTMHKNFKLILMTATFAGSTFVPFFKPLRIKEKDPEPEAILSFEGRTFPITEYFLEDVIEWTNKPLANRHKLEQITETQLAEIDDMLFDADPKKSYREDTLRNLAADQNGMAWISSEKRSMIIEMVKRIDSDARKKIPGENGRGSILIFLPGWKDIKDVGSDLKQAETEMLMQELGQSVNQQTPQGETTAMMLDPYLDMRRFHILPLHSQLVPEEQHQVFDPAPPGRRKIILSTNIAETSVTIPDIVYVLNSGTAKEMQYDSNRMTGVLENVLVSKANNTQRKGRAGRCQEGICIHLYPRFAMQTMKAHQNPEILANSLEEHILQSMCLKLGDPLEFFKKTVSVPPHDRLMAGIDVLSNLGAIEKDENNKYQLTDLGLWLGQVPQHPSASLAMSYAAIFGVLLPCLIGISFAQNRSPFDIKKQEQVEEDCGRGFLGDKFNSDHACVVRAYLDWKQENYVENEDVAPTTLQEARAQDRAKQEAGKRGSAYLEKHGLSKEIMGGVDQNVKSFLHLMVRERGYNADDCSYRQIAPYWNVDKVFSEDRFLLFKLAMALGYTPKFCMRSEFTYEGFCNDQQQDMKMSNQSVNYSFSGRMNKKEMLLRDAKGDGAMEPLIEARRDNCDFLLMNEEEGLQTKTPSDSPYFCLYSEVMAFGNDKKIQMSETTMVNINTVLIASRNFEYDASKNIVIFDGWMGRPNMGCDEENEGLVEEVQELRKALRLSLQKCLFKGCVFEVAKHSTLGPLLMFLKRSICIKDIRGTRTVRASQKDLNSIKLNGLPLDASQFMIRNLLEEQCKVEPQQIESVLIPMNPKSGTGKGFAFIHLTSRDLCKKIVRENYNLNVKGKSIQVYLVEKKDPDHLDAEEKEKPNNAINAEDVDDDEIKNTALNLKELIEGRFEREQQAQEDAQIAQERNSGDDWYGDRTSGSGRYDHGMRHRDEDHGGNNNYRGGRDDNYRGGRDDRGRDDFRGTRGRDDSRGPEISKRRRRDDY